MNQAAPVIADRWIGAPPADHDLPASRCCEQRQLFEHLLPPRDPVLALLESCPCLVGLVTSRIALRVRGEREYRIALVELPEPTAAPETLVRSPAVALSPARH